MQNTWKPFAQEVEKLNQKPRKPRKPHPLDTKAKPKRNDPTEHQGQAALIFWGKFHPIVAEYLFAIPNGGKRTIWAGKKLKDEGLMPGASDLFLSYPSKRFHGYYIEMKRKGEKPNKDQLYFLEKMRKVGYAGAWFDDWELARDSIIDYLS